jgi:phosphoglycolate phosphatase-like HAD superfamily hydrolase
MHVLFWDIDGTLLTTARAGVPALEDGFEAVLGERPSLSEMHTSGLTDRMIVRLILTGGGHDPDDALESAILAAYTRALPVRLEQRRGQVLLGVRETLVDLSARPDVANVLLTGNMRAGAEAKLRSYDLDGFFGHGGGFADDGYDRAAIGRCAVERATEQWGRAAAERALLIGDTPLDVECAQLLGLRAVAVATGIHHSRELAAAGATWVFEQLPSAAVLVGLADEHVAAVPT